MKYNHFLKIHERNLKSDSPFMLSLAHWFYLYARMELGGCVRAKVPHHTVVSKPADFELHGPLYVNVCNWEWQAANAAFTMDTPSFWAAAKLHWIKASGTLQENSPFIFADIIFFLNPEHHDIWSLGQATSREPDTWRVRGAEDYRISNPSTRAIFRLSVSKRRSVSADWKPLALLQGDYAAETKSQARKLQVKRLRSTGTTGLWWAWAM